MNAQAQSDDRGDLPSASLAMLRLRAHLLASVRQFFATHGYWEVETPLLSRDVIVDAHLEPFAVDGSAVDSHSGGVPNPPNELFLQTSPEFGMKRLLAAGADSIYQITRAFRRGELGRYHNPEFTMIEWYRVGDTHHEQMTFTAEFVKSVFRRAERLRADRLGLPFSARSIDLVPTLSVGMPTPDAPRPSATQRVADVRSDAERRHETLSVRRWNLEQPFDRLTYDQAFEKYAGSRVLALSSTQLAELARRHGLVPPPGLHPDDRDGWLNLLLAELVEPQLGREQPVFIYDFPASQAALARLRCGGVAGVERSEPPDGDAVGSLRSTTATLPVAERFELYIGGLEICNGYHELTDPAEYRDRIRRQSAIRAGEGHRPLPQENRLLEAMEAGLPACAGVALGFDRLVMSATGADSLHDVMAFPFDRA